MRNPDCAFQGDTSRALPGILAASSRGQAAVLSGTSVAAPQLTRWIIEGGNPPFARNHYRYGEGMKDPPLDLSRAIVSFRHLFAAAFCSSHFQNKNSFKIFQKLKNIF